MSKNEGLCVMWVMEDQRLLGDVDTWSRAEQFGDGVFETLLVSNGSVAAMSLHAKRLEDGLKQLKIPLPDKNIEELLRQYLMKMVGVSGLKNGVLKVIVSRAKSARGYGFDASKKSVVSVFYSQHKPIETEKYIKGISVQICDTQCAIQRQLAGLKHLNRLENVLAKSELTTQCFEGLMGNELGWLIEGTMSNVFLEVNGVLYTPDLTLSGVEGVMRTLIIRYCQKNEIELNITNIKLKSIGEFNSAFVCNSVIGILAINTLKNKKMVIGQIATQLQAAIQSGEIYA
jgi:4-amino-4-deoxychorismate lyase